MGDAYIQGKWSKMEMREGINRKDLRVLNSSLESWGPQMSGKLALPRVDNTTPVSYANYGAGRVPQLAMLARRVKELEVTSRIAARCNAVADAVSRFSARAQGQVPFPSRGLRAAFRKI